MASGQRDEDEPTGIPQSEYSRMSTEGSGDYGDFPAADQDSRTSRTDEGADDDAQLLVTAPTPSLLTKAEETAFRSSTQNVFEQLRHSHKPDGVCDEVYFSSQQLSSQRWIAVFVVAALYVFFYAAGGLAYYWSDMHGYTFDYSGRIKSSQSTEPVHALHGPGYLEQPE